MQKTIASIIALLILAGAIVVAGTFLLRLSGEAQAASTVCHVNRNSYIFHQPARRYYNCKKCTVVFTLRQESLNAGFRPCKICKP